MTNRKIDLCPLSESDTDFLLRLVTNPDVAKHLPATICEEHMMKQWIQSLSSNDYEYIIRLQDTNEFIGECSITVSRDGQSCEIGYLLLPEYWNCGFGSATVELLLKKADMLGIDTITAIVNPQNSASIRILVKYGFVKTSPAWIIPSLGNEPIDPMEVEFYQLKQEIDHHNSHD